MLTTALTVFTAGCIQTFGEFEPAVQTSAAPAATLEPFLPKDIYDMFLCACCGGTIESECCDSSAEMKNYADELIDAGLSRDEVAAEMVLKYGLDSLINESDRKFFREELVDMLPKERSRIDVDPEVVDLGDVSVASGESSAVVYVSNFGMSNLIISGMKTSCGCTSAALIFNGVEGPIFSATMRDADGWSQTLSHGQQAQLKIYYNATFHPDSRGALTRTVTIFSNDPGSPEKEVTIKLNQVD